MRLASLGKPIAEGLTAEVYAWDETQVLKLFRAGRPREQATYEARIARAVSAAGVPVPAVGDVLAIDGRAGLLYERVDGPSMMDCMMRERGRLTRYARQWAELHADIHARRAGPELPAQRAEIERGIRAAPALPADLRRAALRALRAMPDGDRLCHGDFWPGNVLMSSRGPIVIDWNNATRGNPLADVARSSVLVGGELASPRVAPALKAFIRRGHATYLRRYFELRPRGREECRAWEPIVAAARLNENVPGSEPWLLATAAEGLSKRG